MSVLRLTRALCKANISLIAMICAIIIDSEEGTYMGFIMICANLIWKTSFVR